MIRFSSPAESNYFLLASFEIYLADILKCLTEVFDFIKLKKFELKKKIDALKRDEKQSSLEIDKVIKWISTAEEKLQVVEKIFQECDKARKK